MKNISKIPLFLLLSFSWASSVLGQENGTSTSPPIFLEYILDFQNQSEIPFSMSSVTYEDWFYYYDNLTKEGLTNFADEYFGGQNLSSLELAQGVWVSYYEDGSSPIFGDEFPFIEFFTTQLFDSFELIYYISGNGNITLTGGVDKVLTKNDSDQDLTWQTFSSETNNSFTLLMMPSEEGEFILIDKIIIRSFQLTTTTTIKPTTHENNTTITESTEMSTFESSISSADPEDDRSTTNVYTTTSDEVGNNNSGTTLANLSLWTFLLLIVLTR